MKKFFKFNVYLLSSILVMSCLEKNRLDEEEEDAGVNDYQLVWSDEFDGAGAISGDKWFHQTQLPNGGNWYNGELQHYTNRLENSYLAEGYLHLVAKKESFSDQGHTKSYTSARLNSKFAFTYGRVEVRAKLPKGRGTWPAIWTLGQNIKEPGGYWTSSHGSVGWPVCGEIDIMEHWGFNQDVIQAALHTPSSNGATVNKGSIDGNDVSNTFNLYTMEWTEEKIAFFYNDTLYYTYEPTTKNSENWPYNSPQYLLLNIAMGGVGGDIDPAFIESEMVVDYVRVYQK